MSGFASPGGISFDTPRPHIVVVHFVKRWLLLKGQRDTVGVGELVLVMQSDSRAERRIRLIGSHVVVTAAKTARHGSGIHSPVGQRVPVVRASSSEGSKHRVKAARHCVWPQLLFLCLFGFF